MILTELRHSEMNHIRDQVPPPNDERNPSPSKGASTKWIFYGTLAFCVCFIFTVVTVAICAISIAHNVPKQSSFPSDRPDDVSPSLFSLLREQHSNPHMHQAMQMMKDLGPDHYDKRKSGLCYAWYAYPTRNEGGSDMAKPPTKIQNEHELKQALNPCLIGEEFRAKRAADIEKWIYFITFTADALNVGSEKVLNEGRDRWRLHKCVMEMSEYAMLKKGAAAATLSAEELAFRDAFLQLKAVMRHKGLMNRNNIFYAPR